MEIISIILLHSPNKLFFECKSTFLFLMSLITLKTCNVTDDLTNFSDVIDGITAFVMPRHEFKIHPSIFYTYSSSTKGQEGLLAQLLLDKRQCRPWSGCQPITDPAETNNINNLECSRSLPMLIFEWEEDVSIQRKPMQTQENMQTLQRNATASLNLALLFRIQSKKPL